MKEGTLSWKRPSFGLACTFFLRRWLKWSQSICVLRAWHLGRLFSRGWMIYRQYSGVQVFSGELGKGSEQTLGRAKIIPSYGKHAQPFSRKLSCISGIPGKTGPGQGPASDSE